MYLISISLWYDLKVVYLLFGDSRKTLLGTWGKTPNIRKYSIWENNNETSPRTKVLVWYLLQHRGDLLLKVLVIGIPKWFFNLWFDKISKFCMWLQPYSIAKHVIQKGHRTQRFSAATLATSRGDTAVTTKSKAYRCLLERKTRASLKESSMGKKSFLLKLLK